MKFKYIDRIGVELEGGWDAPPPTEMRRDGSISDIFASCIGEVASSPLKTEGGISTWMRKNYPSHVNKSCGLHIHFSFKELSDYARLMDRKFYAFFMKEMKEFGNRCNIAPTHEFWTRYNGFNSYCSANWMPDDQARRTGKNDTRYCHWNFAYNLHRTTECRMLPMFKDVEIAILAVKQVAATVEKYLAQAMPEIVLGPFDEVDVAHESENITQLVEVVHVSSENDEAEYEYPSLGEGRVIVPLERASKDEFETALKYYPAKKRETPAPAPVNNGSFPDEILGIFGHSLRRLDDEVYASTPPF